jgi:CCR4-NOT transcription complex subunit 7/8
MSQEEKEREEKSSSSDEDSPTDYSSQKTSPKSKIILNNVSSDLSNESNYSSVIVEVYKDNFIQEMKNLSILIKKYKYNYIGMDTEFPGTVYSLSTLTDDFYYKSLKLNVDSLKLIQLGITLSNEKGEYPTPHRTWQFNFEFDYTKDKWSQSSMHLLMSSGIDFNKMKKDGINHKKFIEQMKISGLVLNPDIHWISFHGSYDFAYLLSNLIDNSLPENEKDFTQLLGLFFPNHYDIKILVKDKNNLKGSLNKLANYLNVQREGKNHQAGSDSLVTIYSFWKLIKSGFVTKEELNERKNILYGILRGKDNKETINYMKLNLGKNSNFFANKNNINMNINRNNCNFNNTNYLPFRNNIYNVNMNYFCPQMMNLYNNGFNGMQMMNNRNNLIHFC